MELVLLTTLPAEVARVLETSAGVVMMCLGMLKSVITGLT